jgi:hypothetical protein
MDERPQRKHPFTLMVALCVIAGLLGVAAYMMHVADARVSAMERDVAQDPVPVDVLTVRRGNPRHRGPRLPQRH